MKKTRPGPRQHYVPCWLSQGFATPEHRRGRFVLFRKGKSEVPCSPEDWAVEKRFYEHQGTEIDSGWKDWEAKDAATAARLRSDGMSDAVVNEVPGLLSRLAARTAHARRMLVETIETVGTTILEKERLSGKTGAEIRREAIHRMQNKDPAFRELTRVSLNEKEIRKVTGKRIDKEMRRLAKQARSIPTESFENITERAVTIETANAGAKAVGHHLDWLKREVQDGSVAGKYARREMRYGTLRVKSGILCLGDHAVFEDRENGEDKAYHPLEEVRLQMKAVYLPLGSDTLLVGLAAGAEVQNIHWILNGIAALSAESFISRESNETTAQMHQRIGAWRRTMSESEVMTNLQNTRWRRIWEGRD